MNEHTKVCYTSMNKLKILIDNAVNITA